MRVFTILLFLFLAPFLAFTQSNYFVMVSPFNWDSVEIINKYPEVCDFINDNLFIENNLIKLKNISINATDFENFTITENEFKIVIPFQYLDYDNLDDEHIVESGQSFYVFIVLNGDESTNEKIGVKRNYIRFNNDQPRTVITV